MFAARAVQFQHKVTTDELHLGLTTHSTILLSSILRISLKKSMAIIFLLPQISCSPSITLNRNYGIQLPIVSYFRLSDYSIL